MLRWGAGGTAFTPELDPHTPHRSDLEQRLGHAHHMAMDTGCTTRHLTSLYGTPPGMGASRWSAFWGWASRHPIHSPMARTLPLARCW